MGQPARAQGIRDHALEVLPSDEALSMEDTLWWMRGRKAIIRRYLQDMSRRRRVATLMDIGCGSGGTLDVLGEFGRVLAVEPSPTLAERARTRGVAETVFEDDFRRVDACREVDAFTLFDVLEHIQDDLGFLADLRRTAAPGHQVLLSVPALPMLYSEHDRVLHHHRRYSARMLRDLIRSAGYELVAESYFMCLLFPLVLAMRAKDALLARLRSGEASINLGGAPPMLSRLLESTLSFEAWVSRSNRLPIGLWLFAQLRAPRP